MKGKVIVISGGTKGAGRTLAQKCIAEGAIVVIGGRDKDAFDALMQECGSDNLHFYYTDLKNIKQSLELFDFVHAKFQRLDGLVNYAGITPIASLTDCDEELYDEVMAINLKAVFFNCQAAINLMKDTGGGAIVLIGSSHAWRGEENRAPYAISKGALFTLQEHIVAHYSKYTIRCNYVTMGWTATDGELLLRKNEGVDKERLEEIAAGVIPMGRLITTDEIVSGIMYLLSDASRMVTGSNLKISGGEYI